MPHETLLDNQGWFKKLARRFGPGHVVNTCFLIVMLFSTLLTWREVMILKDAYVASQRNHLGSVANVLDRQLQFNMDRLIFLRNGMHEALVAPLAFSALQSAVTQFEQRRVRHFWQLELDKRRTLPLYGVSDQFVARTTLLSRESRDLANELTATLELGYLARLARSSAMLTLETMYVSRSGFYLSTLPTAYGSDIVSRYYQYVTQPWFIEQSQRRNPQRGVRWFTSAQPYVADEQKKVTASLPLDHDNYWYGVLAMDIPVASLQRFLRDAAEKDIEGEYQLYDNHLRLLTDSAPEQQTANTLNDRERALLAREIEKDTLGGLRLGTHYVSWERLDHFDGVLLRVHTLREGIQGNFGSISIALTLLWVLFTAMLLISWGVIRHMVKNMIVEITQLIINLIVPAIAGIVIDDLKNAVFVGILDVINAAETVIVPNKVGILARAGREGVARPAFAFNDVVIDLRAVILIHALNANTFFFVCAHFVVHDDVEQHRNIIFFERVYRRQ